MGLDNKQIVKRFLDASMAGDRETMDRLMSPEASVVEAESLPYAGTYKGVPGFLDLVRRVYSTFSDVDVTITEFISENDHVIVMAMLSGKTRRSRTPFQMPVVEDWRLRDDRIIGIRPFYFDTAKMNELAAG